MRVVRLAVVPRVVVPPATVVTIVVTFLVALFVTTVVMDYLTIVYDATGQAQHERTQAKRCEQERPV